MEAMISSMQSPWYLIDTASPVIICCMSLWFHCRNQLALKIVIYYPRSHRKLCTFHKSMQARIAAKPQPQQKINALRRISHLKTN